MKTFHTYFLTEQTDALSQMSVVSWFHAEGAATITSARLPNNGRSRRHWGYPDVTTDCACFYDCMFSHYRTLFFHVVNHRRPRFEWDYTNSVYWLIKTMYWRNFYAV